MSNWLTTKRLQDWINVTLAALLFISPWVLGYVEHEVAALNACAAAVLIAGFALAALTAFADWEEWINLALGLWVAAAPWLLGFAGVATGAWAHVVIGLLVAALAAWELWQEHHQPKLVA
jgi:heme/copper-type cytochrome/quinol oxidase subunit 3